MQTTSGPSASAQPDPPPRLTNQGTSAASARHPARPGRPAGSGVPQGQRRGTRRGRPWVGRSYLHLAFPVPALDAVHLDLLDVTLSELGWSVTSDEQTVAGQPVLSRRWSNGQTDLVLVVLGWYPLLVTLGTEGRANSRVRKAERRLADAAVAAGGREVADRELDQAVARCRERWPQALAARRTIEEHSRWLACRTCRACGAWSAYGTLHCRGCARRFAPEDDAERDEQGRAAAAATAAAEQQLATLGRGDGMFPGWPAGSEAAGGGPVQPPRDAYPPQPKGAA